MWYRQHSTEGRGCLPVLTHSHLHSNRPASPSLCSHSLTRLLSVSLSVVSCDIFSSVPSSLHPFLLHVHVSLLFTHTSTSCHLTSTSCHFTSITLFCPSYSVIFLAYYTLFRLHFTRLPPLYLPLSHPHLFSFSSVHPPIPSLPTPPHALILHSPLPSPSLTTYTHPQ